MKRLIPVYVLLTLMLAGVVTFGVLSLRELKAMHGELTAIKKVNYGGVMQVEVVNTPTVEIENTPLDVSVSEPLDVNVTNEPEVHVSP